MARSIRVIATYKTYNSTKHDEDNLHKGPSPLKDLPVDVMACVVDELRDDPRALSACSLASRTWRHLAQRTIFHTVTLDSERRAKRLIQLLSENLVLANYVRALEVSASNHVRQKKRAMDLQGWITRLLPGFAATLPHVRSLHFEDVEWNTLVGGLDASFGAGLRTFGGVKDLQFSGCKFDTFQDFETIVWNFAGNMSRLTLREIIWYSFDAVARPYHLPLHTLRVVSGCALGTIPAWLIMLQVGRPNSPLKNLEFHEMPDTDFSRLGCILRDVGPNLQSLKLGVRVTVVEQRPLVLQRQDVCRWLSLDKNVQLRYLTIRVIDLDPDLMYWIQNFLRLVNEGSLHTLTFEVWLGVRGQVAGPVWDDIAWLISETPRFTSLQEVRFVNRGSLDIDIASHDIRKQFHRLHARRKLVVENQRNFT